MTVLNIGRLSLLLIAVLMTGCVNMANYELGSSDNMFSRVVEVEGASKDELFDRAMQFVALNYVNANEVVQYRDKDAGKIIIKGVVGVQHPETFVYEKVKFSYTEVIEVKDAKARIYRYNFTYLLNGVGMRNADKAWESRALFSATFMHLTAFESALQGKSEVQTPGW